MPSFGKRIKYFRVDRQREKTGAKMSQTELGLKAFGSNSKGAAQAKIKKLEAGTQDLKKHELQKICKVLEVSVDEFLNADIENFLSGEEKISKMDKRIETFSNNTFSDNMIKLFPKLPVYVQICNLLAEDGDEIAQQNIISNLKRFIERYEKKGMTITE